MPDKKISVEPDNFCIGPFAEIRINPDGKMGYCHAADLSMTPDHENIFQHTVDDYFSLTADSYRASLIQGQPLAACHRCYRNEKNKVISFRQRRNLQAAIFPGDDFVPSVHEAWSRISSWRKPRFYHVSLSNLCNMACMMCSPVLSSAVAVLHKKVGLWPKDSAVLRDWTQDEMLWKNFVRHLLHNDDIVSLHIMGGEPMYHRRFLQLLDTLIEHDHCDFALTVVTNGSIFDPGIIDRLEKFREAVIEISIESLDLANDYIRYPSNYQNIQKNIEQYMGARTANISVVLRSVPQFFSVLGYDRLLEFARDHNVMIDSNILHKPSFLKANLLPEDIKFSVVDRLSRFVRAENPAGVKQINLRDITDLDQSLSRHAQMVIDEVVQSASDRSEQIKNLVDYCKKLDLARQISVKSYVPELASFFEQHGYDDPN
jgi:pyruvate-formate lyase-activating enzyme